MLADTYANALARLMYWLGVGYVIALGIIVVGFILASILENGGGHDKQDT